MQPIEIWPNGDFEFGTADIDGKPYYVVQMRHQGGDPVIALFFNQASFVSFADHLKMVADAIVSGDYPHG